MTIKPEATHQERPVRRERITTIHILGSCVAGLVLGHNLSYNIDAIESEIDAHTDHTLLSTQTSDIARTMFGEHTTVTCSDSMPSVSDSRMTVGGYVSPFILTVPFTTFSKIISPKTMHIDSQVCRNAVAAAEQFSDTSDPGINQRMAVYAEALAVLSHEDEHIHGVLSEAAAECYSLQRLDSQLQALGIRSLVAKRISDTAVRVAERDEPSNYTSAECRPGGTLDLGISNNYLIVK